jgi:hypothetical protein
MSLARALAAEQVLRSEWELCRYRLDKDVKVVGRAYLRKPMPQTNPRPVPMMISIGTA